MSSKKPFFEVFNSYEPVSEEIRELLSDVMVSGITMTSTRSKIDVYIDSPHPVHKKDIYAIQKELAASLDRKGRVRVLLHEHFSLSSQYNAENFYDEYKGSIAYGMKAEKPVMYSIYHQARKGFDESGSLIITLADTIIAHDVAEDLKKYLSDIFAGKAGLSCNIKIGYEKTGPSPERLEMERRVQKEIAEISGRAIQARTVAGPDKTRNYRRPSQDRGSGAYKGSRGGSSFGHAKKSSAGNPDDPDVIYRGDTPEQSTPIADIDGETGEVTIRGEVISYEDKEVKDGTLLMMRFNITDYTDTISVRIFPPIEEGKKLRDDIAP
ncbi:MAG: hypothetical protein J5966_11320, partial [Lachnospiraceae bacterium]|nr:hypothetical protein [Lachnospiraceae bacterium]